MFEFEEDLSVGARIKVVGLGGGGGNAIKTMMEAHVPGVDFMAINTDVQSLKAHAAPVRIQIGKQLTRGLSTGANPDIGRQAALEDAKLIKDSLTGCDLIFVVAGLGGGTGSGAVPVVSRLAREEGILTVGIVTKPFSFEGRRRTLQAEAAINALKLEADATLVIANDNLLSLADKNTPLLDGFKMVDKVLLQAVRSLSDLITSPGLISLDFADVNVIMRKAGFAAMGGAMARGEGRAVQAAKQALSCPLLGGMRVAEATGILLNITGSANMTLFEVNEACKLVQQELRPDANFVFGSVIDEGLGDGIGVTVLATGFKMDEGADKLQIPLNIRAVVEDLKAEGMGTLPPVWGEEKSEPVIAPLRQPAPEAILGGEPLMETAGVARPVSAKEMTLSKQQGEFKQSLRDLSNMIDHDDDKYEIPAFIRRRAD